MAPEVLIRTDTGREGGPPAKRLRLEKAGAKGKKRNSRSIKKIADEGHRNAAQKAAEAVARFIVFENPMASNAEMDAEVRRQVVQCYGSWKVGGQYAEAVRHLGYRGRGAMRDMLAKHVDKAYGISALPDKDKLALATWLASRDRFCCPAAFRMEHGGHFGAPEMLRVIVDCYVAPVRSNNAYCRGAEEFLAQITPEFICLVSAGILWWLNGWVNGQGVEHKTEHNFSVEVLKGK